MRSLEHPILARFYDALTAPQERLGMRRQRERTVHGARGRVLELAVGTGLNLPLYPATVSEIVGVDADPHMLRRARRRADKAVCPVSLVEADAQALPCADAEFNTVVVTLGLCTIPDPDAALREARRVLAPGGRLVFLEHVRSPSALAAHCQDVISPLWQRVAGGCHLNRDTAAAVARYFTVEHIWQQGILIQGSARPA